MYGLILSSKAGKETIKAIIYGTLCKENSDLLLQQPKDCNEKKSRQGDYQGSGVILS